MEIAAVAQDFLVVLLAGLVSGIVCKRFKISLLVGYLVVGALIGRGGLGWVADTSHELDQIAEAGALLLLFSVAIEFSIDELAKLSRFVFIGGPIQILLVTVPVALIAWLAGLRVTGAILIGAASALSSTVLVFRALVEAGETESTYGRRGVAVLLFQDAVLVPLLLVIPLLKDRGAAPAASVYLAMAAKSLAFLVGVYVVHRLLARVVVPLVAALRSVELVVLLTVTLLTALCWIAHWLDLPSAVGDFRGGDRIEWQSAEQADRYDHPAVSRDVRRGVFRHAGDAAAPGRVSLRAVAVGGRIGRDDRRQVAGRRGRPGAVGLPWRAALGMGLGLCQLGEFSFLLAAAGVADNVIDAENYNRLLFIALATLILTPWLLGRGLRWAGAAPSEEPPPQGREARRAGARALVVGAGPIGGRIATRLETMGIDLALLDLSPINLHPFAQQGFATLAGDAIDPRVLRGPTSPIGNWRSSASRATTPRWKSSAPCVVRTSGSPSSFAAATNRTPPNCAKPAPRASSARNSKPPAR